MPSTTEAAQGATLEPTPADIRIAWLTALALSLHVLEAAVPSPLPGLKPGLANVITVATLVLYGFGAAAWVSLLRVMAGGLILGTLFSPTFILSLGGAVASVAILGLMHVMDRGRRIGPVGYSVPAALAHMAGQVGVAYVLFVPNPGLLYLLPALLTGALIFGIINGIIAVQMLLRLPTN